jgi:hypothetical protein
MNLTISQQIEIANGAWEAAVAARDKIGRKMDKVEKKEVPMGPDYVRQINEIELCRIQYVALNEFQEKLWQDLCMLKQLGA